MTIPANLGKLLNFAQYHHIMKFAIISASPKGENSITYHTILYLQKHYSDDTWQTYHIGKSKRHWEDAFSAILTSDLTIFCYPVYTFLAPSRLHQFMQMLKERGGYEGKAYLQISTSKHFYDITAHAWVDDNCADLGMLKIGSLSADMDDLLSAKGRKEALDFWKMAIWRLQSGVYIPIHKIEPAEFKYDGSAESDKLSFLTPDLPLTGKQTIKNKVVVVASIEASDAELRAMISDYADASEREVEVFNVNEFPFKGSCISCFNCASTGNCIYTDHFDVYLREHILTARAIVYAFRIKDHSMGCQMKVYDDRQFCNGHRTVTMGMPVGFIVAGDCASEANLQRLMAARADVGGNLNAGVASNLEQIRNLAATIDFALEHEIAPTRSFWGVGGMKIFRDLIWMMQGLMRQDHKFFKSHGQYDFPQKRRKDMISSYLIGALMNNKKLRQKAGSKISEGMIAPYKKVLE